MDKDKIMRVSSKRPKITKAPRQVWKYVVKNSVKKKSINFCVG